MLLVSFYLAGLSLLSLTTAQLSGAPTLSASIKYDTGYSLLPGCINQCIWDIGDNDTPKIGGDLAIHLSCAAPYPNGCYCRGQSAAFAYSFVTSCASFLCSTPAASDIYNGISVYTSYCSKALGAAYTPNAVPESAAPMNTAQAASTGLGAAASRPTSSVPKQTGSSSPSTSSSPSPSAGASQASDDKIAGLSKGAFIGVVISASCSVLGMMFGIGFKVYKHKKQTKTQQEQAVTNVYYTPKV